MMGEIFYLTFVLNGKEKEINKLEIKVRVRFRTIVKEPKDIARKQKKLY